MSLTITLPTGAELEALLEQLSGKRHHIVATTARTQANRHQFRVS